MAKESTVPVVAKPAEIAVVPEKVRWTVIPGNNLGDRTVWATSAAEALAAYEKSQGVILPTDGWEETAKDGNHILKHVPLKPQE